MKRTMYYPAGLMLVVFIAVFPFRSASADPGGYVGVFGGYTYDADASWRYGNVSYDLDVKDTEVLGVTFGYCPPEIGYFAVEFEYSYLNPDKGWSLLTTSGEDYTALEGDLSLHNFIFNAIVRYPTGKIHPYCGLGLGFSYFDFSATSISRIDNVEYTARTSTDDFILAWQMLAGIAIDITDKLSLDIGCRYLDTEADDDDYYDDHHHYDYYDARLEYNTAVVVLGLKYMVDGL